MSKIVTHFYKGDDIDKAITVLENDAKTLQQKIHNIAASICQEWQAKSGAKNISDAVAFDAAKEAAARLNKLQAASPYHANAFSKWVGMMCPLKWSDENSSWYADGTDEYRLTGKQFIEARDNPFWKVSPPSKPKPFVMFAELERIVNKAVKHSSKGVEGDAFNSDAILKVKEAMHILSEAGLAPTE